MISTPSPFPSATTTEPFATTTPYRIHLQRSVSWGAIFAGMTTALAMQVLFMMLGAGLGFAIYTPLTDAKPVTNLGAGALVVQGVSAVFSLWLGGWVAGRFTPTGVRATGWLHGFSVWCVATVAGVLFVSAGASWALGDLSKLVGGGLSMAGKPAAALTGGAADIAKDALKQSNDTLASFSDEALGHLPTDASKNTSARAKREIGLAVARLFNPLQQSNPAENRAAAVKALVDYAGMSEADADKTITEWTATYDRLKADLAAAKNEAEAKARVAAEEASKALAIFSLCSFAAFAMGAFAAGWGGHQGAKCAVRRAQADLAIG